MFPDRPDVMLAGLAEEVGIYLDFRMQDDALGIQAVKLEILNVVRSLGSMMLNATWPHSCGMAVVTTNALMGMIPGNSVLAAKAWWRN